MLGRCTRVLVKVGVIGTERRGAWAYYYLVSNATDELVAWLT
jgi:hypothetical protein